MGRFVVAISRSVVVRSWSEVPARWWLGSIPFATRLSLVTARPGCGQRQPRGPRRAPDTPRSSKKPGDPSSTPSQEDNGGGDPSPPDREVTAVIGCHRVVYHTPWL